MKISLFVLIAISLTSLNVADAHRKCRRQPACKPQCHSKLNPLPYNHEVKTFGTSLIPSPALRGSVHVLRCPIISKELEDELLCGLDPKYSTHEIVFYSGFINDPYPAGIPGAPPKLSITCIDVIVHNMLKNLDTKFLWHGKCYMNLPAPTEVYFPHDVSMRFDNHSTEYNLTESGKTLYNLKMPALSDPSYTTYQLPDNKSLSTVHIHMHDKFSSMGPVPDFCPAKPLSTSVMNINFGNMKKSYYLKLKNLDDLTISPDFSVKLGLKNPLNKASLDQTKCIAGFWHDIRTMDTLRAVTVAKNVTMPPKNENEPLSTMAHFPRPYEHMSDEILRNLTVLRDQANTRYDVNTEFMKIKHCDEY